MFSLHGLPLGINNDQILFRHETLAHGSRSRQHMAVLQPYADVSVKGRHIAKLVDASADLDNVLAVLLQSIFHLSLPRTAHLLQPRERKSKTLNSSNFSTSLQRASQAGFVPSETGQRHL